MKKPKAKTKNQDKEAAAGSSRGQVVKLKAVRGKPSVLAKLETIPQWWTQITTFVAEAWQELKKVTWPGRKETVGTTAVVLVLVVIIAAFLGLVDMGLSALVKRIVR